MERMDVLEGKVEKVDNKIRDRMDTIFQFIFDPLDRLSPYLVEFYGTFILVFIWCMVGVLSPANGVLGPLAVASVIISQVFTGGHISGAHYNPAVTFAIFMSGRHKIGFLNAIGYIAAQILASFFAAFFAWACVPSYDCTWGDGIAGPGVYIFQQFLVEFTVTFALCYTALNVATTKAQELNHYFGFAIGFTVLLGAISVGPISGGFFNPAVGTGPLIVKAISYQNATYLQMLWLVWVAPLTGAFFASFYFRATNSRDYDKFRSREEHRKGVPDLFHDDASVQESLISPD